MWSQTVIQSTPNSRKASEMLAYRIREHNETSQIIKYEGKKGKRKKRQKKNRCSEECDERRLEKKSCKKNGIRAEDKQILLHGQNNTKIADGARTNNTKWKIPA